MGLFDFTWNTPVGSAYSGQIAYDGTYVWFITHDSSNVRRLYRLRHSDKQLIKPDGTVGDYSNAYVSVPLTNTYGLPDAIVTNGTILWINTHDYIHRWDCATMTKLGNVNTGGPVATSGWRTRRAAFDGTYAWFGGATTSTGNSPILWRISNTGGIAWYTPASLALIRGLTYGGGYLWAIPDAVSTTLLQQIDTSGNVIRTITGDHNSVAPTGSPEGLYYDSNRGEIVLAMTGSESIRVRASDGAFIKWDGTVSATASGARVSSVTLGTDCSLISSAGAIVVNDATFIGGQGINLNTRSMQRRSMSNGFGSGLWNQTLPHGVYDFLIVENTLYGSLGGPQYWSSAGVMWATISDASLPPNLTAVTPKVGPTLGLTFSGQVNVSSPTIGPATAGIGVTSVTAPDTTHVDISIDTPPIHPIGQAQEEPDIQPPAAAAYLMP